MMVEGVLAGYWLISLYCTYWLPKYLHHPCGELLHGEY